MCYLVCTHQQRENEVACSSNQKKKCFFKISFKFSLFSLMRILFEFRIVSNGEGGIEFESDVTFIKSIEKEVTAIEHSPCSMEFPIHQLSIIPPSHTKDQLSLPPPSQKHEVLHPSLNKEESIGIDNDKIGSLKKSPTERILSDFPKGISSRSSLMSELSSKLSQRRRIVELE